MAHTPSDKMSDTLRLAIIESDIPYQRIEKATGVQRLSIARFVDGQTSMRLDKAATLADYFGLELRPKKRG